MNRTRSVAVSASLCFLFTFLCSTLSCAQASAGADIAAGISVFAGASHVDPDYGPNSQSGFVFGADYTRYLSRFYLDPSLELRALVSPMGSTVSEKVYGGGLKLEHPFRRVHPYADFLVGAGTIHYQGPFSDNSTVYTYGGGADVSLAYHFAVKVDFQDSHWHPGKNFTYTPTSFNIGLLYRIPFAPRYAH